MNKTINKNTTLIIQYTILLVLIYLVVFLKLGSFHIRWWDESVFAVNTYEMLENGKWFSLYFDHHPDFFNTKPPLTNWVQALFVKVIGYNETALRLPSAIAVCVLILVLFGFVRKHFNTIWAWTSSLILLTSYGFIHFHTARTAECDSLLSLFLLLMNICFIRFILYEKQKQIIYFFLFFVLAFATKLHAAMLFIPAYLIILLFKKQFKRFTFSWPFVLGLTTSIIVIGGLFHLREVDAPGYINEVIFHDVARLTHSIENNEQPASFYLENLYKSRFSAWFVLFILGSLLLYFKDKSESKEILIMFLLLITSHLGILSISTTKLEWYDMPLYPYLSVLAAYPIYVLINRIEYKEKQISKPWEYGILALCFLYPYILMFNKSQGNVIRPEEKKLEANERFIFEKIRKEESLDGMKVLYEGWNGSLLFYKYKLAEKGEHIELIRDLTNVSINDKVLVCRESLDRLLQENFEVDLADSVINARLYALKKKRVQPVNK